MAGLAAMAAAMTLAAGASAQTDPIAWDTAASVEQQAERVSAPRKAVIISDSAMAGVRWNGALEGFKGFDADDRLQSCRRLVAESCRGREGIRPPTVEQEILLLDPAGPNDVLVIAVGYNDWHERFADDARLVLDTARERGFAYVAWVTYREVVDYTLPQSGDTSDYSVMNTELRAVVESGEYPELHLWDLDAYTLDADDWFYDDGVHERPRGSWGVADWISRHMAALDERPCPLPWSLALAPDAVCPNPDEAVVERGRPDIAAIYGV